MSQFLLSYHLRCRSALHNLKCQKTLGTKGSSSRAALLILPSLSHRKSTSAEMATSCHQNKTRLTFQWPPTSLFQACHKAVLAINYVGFKHRLTMTLIPSLGLGRASCFSRHGRSSHFPWRSLRAAREASDHTVLNMLSAQCKYYFKDNFLTNTVCQPPKTNVHKRMSRIAKM